MVYLSIKFTICIANTIVENKTFLLLDIHYYKSRSYNGCNMFSLKFYVINSHIVIETLNEHLCIVKRRPFNVYMYFLIKIKESYVVMLSKPNFFVKVQVRNQM